jgi:hypothetical protein
VETHFDVVEGLVAYPDVGVDDVVGYLTDDVVGCHLAEGEVLNGVGQSHAMLVQSQFDAGIEDFQNFPTAMRERVDMFGQVEAKFESFKPVSVDETKVEFEHVGQEVFRDVPVEQKFGFLLGEEAVVDLQYFQKSAEVEF